MRREGDMGILDGKVAIVTGAGHGIGRGEALELAAEGAKVVVNDLGSAVTGEGADARPAEEVAELIRARGGEAVTSFDDVADWTDAQNLVRSSIDAFGRLDVVVNNAGILRDRMIFNMTEGDWDSVVRVHLKGTFAVTHHACVYWREESKAGRQPRASIINTVSGAGLQGNVGQANYGSAKAAIAALSIITSLEMSRYGVRSNAVAPGGWTRMSG
ncbi:MAG: SDR family NAD(P)-dependent oxidoreductase, partial [Actinomycetota bacterium]